MKSIPGGTLKDFVNTNIAITQNIQSEFMIGIANSDTEEQIQEHADRLPTISLREREISGRVANLVLGRIVMQPKPTVVSSDATTTAAGAVVATSTAIATTNAAAAAAATATATTSNTVHSTNAAAPHAAVETEVASKSTVVAKAKEETTPALDNSLKQLSTSPVGKIHVRYILTKADIHRIKLYRLTKKRIVITTSISTQPLELLIFLNSPFHSTYLF